MIRAKGPVLLLMGLFSLLLAGGGRIGQAQEKMPLRVGYLPVLAQLPLVVSHEEDRLNLTKVDLSLVKYNSFTSLEAALRVGAIDAASVPPPIALAMAADGLEIYVLGAFQRGGSRLVTLEKGDLASLRGRLIGVPGLDSNENLKLIQALSTVGLRYGLDFKTIGIPFKSVIEDLKKQKLDGIFLPEPYGTLAEQKDVAHSSNGHGDLLDLTLGTILVVRAEILAKNRAGLEEWLKSLVKACQFIENDIVTSGARQTAIIQAGYFNFPDDTVIDSLTGHKGHLKFTWFFPDRQDMETCLASMNKLRLLNKSVDLAKLLSVELIKKASP